MTAIQWTDETWNPVTGCTKVSAGCKNCYAEALAPRVFAGQVEPIVAPVDEDPRTGQVRVDVVDTRARRFTDVRCHPERLEKPLRWRKPRRVFVNSMSDLFHEDVPDEFILRVFNTMRACWTDTPRRGHTFQILTKRPERMRDVCRRMRFDGAGAGRLWLADHPDDIGGWPLMGATPGSEPLPNVWLGVSVEDQATADERIPILLDTPAAVRWISAEPVLGPIDLWGARYANPNGGKTGAVTSWDGGLDWVVCGGESGRKARPCDVAWIRSIVEQCRAAGVPCFVKQLGTKPGTIENSPIDGAVLIREFGLSHPKGGDPAEWPEDLREREWPEVSP